MTSSLCTYYPLYRYISCVPKWPSCPFCITFKHNKIKEDKRVYTKQQNTQNTNMPNNNNSKIRLMVSFPGQRG